MNTNDPVIFATDFHTIPNNEQLIEEIRRLNENLEALLAASQGQLLARLVDVLRDLRQIAAGTLEYTISGDA